MDGPGEVALLAARGLVRAGGYYGRDQLPLFEPIDVEVRGGDRVALRGSSGTGKTLVLRALTLLDPPSAGEILWRGEPIPDAEVPAHRRRVHLLAQSAALIEGTTADNLALPFTVAAATGDYDRGRALELLEAFDVGALAERDVRDLSGGERQIVALTRALLVGPEVLLLDEPTTALDPARTAIAEALIGQWHAEDEDRASVWVSHDAAQLDRATTSAVTVVKATPGGER